MLLGIGNYKQKGFTLIELLVVISIIGLLASIAVASLNYVRAKARDAVRLATVKQVRTALDLYYDVNGAYPRPNNQHGIAVFGDNLGVVFPSTALGNCLEDGSIEGFQQEGGCINGNIIMDNIPKDPSNPPFEDVYDVCLFGDHNWTCYMYYLSGSSAASQGYEIYFYLETETDLVPQGRNKINHEGLITTT